MEIIYLMIAILPYFAEVSSKIDTSGIFRKFFIGLLSFGGLLGAMGYGGELALFAVSCLYLEKIIYHHFPKIRIIL
jgi:hypothetical protein